MAQCININHPDYIDLLQESGLHEDILKAKISIWMEENGEDRIPALEELAISPLMPVTQERLNQVQELFESNPELAKSVYEALGLKSKLSDIKPKVSITNYRNVTKQDKQNAVNGDIEAQKKWMIEEISEFYEAVDGFNNNTMSIDDVGEEVLGLFRTAQQFPEVKDFINPYIEDVQIALDNINKKEQYDKFKSKKTAKGQAEDMTFDNLFDVVNSFPNSKKQQALQQYSQYLNTIFPDSKVEEMDDNLYISVLNQLEQENKIEKDCSGGKLKAKEGISTLFEKGGKWEIITDFKNAPTHKSGGKDISIQGKKVEVEKNELRIENDFGDVAVIPSKYRVEIQDAIKSNCHSCIDGIVESLPKMKDYAGDGTVFPFFGRYKRFKNSLPDNLKNTPESDYAMRYYWKHGNKPKSFDEAINREQPMFTMEDDGFYHAPSVEPNTLRFLKPKNHPTLQYELDWYNSDNPDAVDFRSKYDLDTNGKFYRYVPKK